jgi:hypothetical protein
MTGLRQLAKNCNWPLLAASGPERPQAAAASVPFLRNPSLAARAFVRPSSGPFLTHAGLCAITPKKVWQGELVVIAQLTRAVDGRRCVQRPCVCEILKSQPLPPTSQNARQVFMRPCAHHALQMHGYFVVFTREIQLEPSPL